MHPLPPDYLPLPGPGGAMAVARRDALEGVREALATGGTLERWASSHPDRREMRGRGTVYAVRLPAGGPAVVVRHARHGGMLARITGDRFFRSGRAPRELRIALRLAAADVPTPAVVAYVSYPAGPLLSRIDVATEEVVGGLDLPAALERWPADRAAIVHAVGGLLGRLTRAGVRHPDLNVKNVLVANTPVTGVPHADAPAARAPGAAPVAYLLDVDRVLFGGPDDPSIAAANVARLTRSARKWARRGVTLLGDDELVMLAYAAGAPDAVWR